METVREWIAHPHAGEVWVHGLDLLEHILRFDPAGSALKRSCRSAIDSTRRYVQEAREAIQKHQHDTALDDAVMELNSRPRRRSRPRLDVDGDDLNVDAYLEAGQDLAGAKVWDLEERVEDKRKPAVTMVLDVSVPWGMRKDDFIITRQRMAYRIAMACEAEKRPCRIIAAIDAKYPGDFNDEIVKWRIILKDWDEPIFPALWAMFRDNRTTNSAAINGVAVAVVGCVHEYNGVYGKFTLDLPADQVVVLAGPEDTRMVPGPDHIVIRDGQDVNLDAI